MFSFFKKSKPSLPESLILPIDTDMHCHVLPGIDDGSPDIETSIHLIKSMHAMGIKKIFATPHIIGDLYKNDLQSVSTALAKVQDALKKNQINIEISAAAEYMLDDYFLNLLRSGEPLLTVKDNLILTELPYTSPPFDLDEIAFEIITAGYQPIMAHPERYFYYHHKLEAYHHLKELGFLLQLNMLSLTGYYGTAVTKAAIYLLDKGLIDLAASDLHHDKHLHALNNSLSKIYHQLIGKNIMNASGMNY